MSSTQQHADVQVVRLPTLLAQQTPRGGPNSARSRGHRNSAGAKFEDFPGTARSSEQLDKASNEKHSPRSLLLLSPSKEASPHVASDELLETSLRLMPCGTAQNSLTSANLAPNLACQVRKDTCEQQGATPAWRPSLLRPIAEHAGEVSYLLAQRAWQASQVVGCKAMVCGRDIARQSWPLLVDAADGTRHVVVEASCTVVAAAGATLQCSVDRVANCIHKADSDSSSDGEGEDELDEVEIIEAASTIRASGVNPRAKPQAGRLAREQLRATVGSLHAMPKVASPGTPPVPEMRVGLLHAMPPRLMPARRLALESHRGALPSGVASVPSTREQLQQQTLRRRVRHVAMP